jgi:hypothetical protein
MMGATMGLMLANFEWNIFLRGILFPAIMFIILCGSSYLLMATNMGNRLGFLVAAAGLAGWMFLMSIVWMLYGIGLRGKDPSWKVADVITGTNNLNIAQNQNVSAIADLPFQSSWCKTDADVADSEAAKVAAKMPEGIAKTRATAAAEKAVEAEFAKRRAKVKADTGWEPLCPGNGQRGDGQATVDATLVTKKSDPTKTPQAIFAESTQYHSIAAYRQGGDNYLFKLRKHKFFLRHSPHWFVMQVQPAQVREVEEPVLGPGRVPLKNEDGTPQVTKREEFLKDVDKAKPITTVVMLRDQGSRRQPPFFLAIFSGALFAIIVSVLHQRDKQVMALAKAAKNRPATA